MVSSTALTDAIRTYNEYRSPMANASLVDSTAETFTVRFEGPFCRMCCDYDYFEDLVYELLAVGVDIHPIEIADITYDGDERFVVQYSTRA